MDVLSSLSQLLKFVFVFRGVQLFEKERHTVFQCLLHMVDISHPGKPWLVHSEWSSRICEEFHIQGDVERELGIPISPLCDRNNQNIPNSQISKIVLVIDIGL